MKDFLSALMNTFKQYLTIESANPPDIDEKLNSKNRYLGCKKPQRIFLVPPPDVGRFSKGGGGGSAVRTQWPPCLDTRQQKMPKYAKKTGPLPPCQISQIQAIELGHFYPLPGGKVHRLKFHRGGGVPDPPPLYLSQG